MDHHESAPSGLDYLHAPPGAGGTSGLTRRGFLRTSAGATGVALGGWRWLSLVGPPVAAATPVLQAWPALAANSALAAAQSAGVNAFLEFPSPANTVQGQLEVRGESLDPVHPNTIEIIAASLGVENQQTISGNSGAGGGKTEFSALQITKAIDAASAPLFRLLAEGASLPEARLYIRRPGAEADYIEYRFGLVFVTSIETASPAPSRLTSAATSGSSSTQLPTATQTSGDNTPSEIIQMVFGAMEVNYTPDPAGPTATADWSKVRNEPNFDVN